MNNYLFMSEIKKPVNHKGVEYEFRRYRTVNGMKYEMNSSEVQFNMHLSDEKINDIKTLHESSDEVFINAFRDFIDFWDE